MYPRRLLDLSIWASAAGSFCSLIAASWGPAPWFLVAFPGTDHLFHFTGYFLATFFLLLAAVWHPWRGRGPFEGMKAWLLAGTISIAAAVEIGQLAAHQRTPDALDAVANLAGVAVGGFAWRTLRSGVRRFSAAAVPRR